MRGAVTAAERKGLRKLRAPPGRAAEASELLLRATLPGQDQIRDPDKCHEGDGNGPGKPVHIFHDDADAELRTVRRASISLQNARSGRSSASAHSSRTFSSRMKTRNSC